jgi:hypothetical protein
LQAVWGLDVWFYPTHAMSRSPQKLVFDLIAQGSYKKEYDARFKIYTQWTEVGKLLPPKSRAVLHDNHVHLGINTSTINDWTGWQYGLSYVRLGTPSAMWKTLKEEMGATHVVWEKMRCVGWDTLGSDLLFFEFAHRHTVDRKTAGNTVVGRMPDAAPSDQGRNDLVAVMTCDKQTYRRGLYKVTDLITPVFGPNRGKYPAPRVAEGDDAALLSQAAFAVVDPTCFKGKTVTELNAFENVAKRARVYAPSGKKTFDLYLRKEGVPAAAPPPAGDSGGARRDDEMIPGEQPDGATRGE